MTYCSSVAEHDMRVYEVLIATQSRTWPTHSIRQEWMATLLNQCPQRYIMKIGISMNLNTCHQWAVIPIEDLVADALKKVHKSQALYNSQWNEKCSSLTIVHMLSWRCWEMLYLMLSKKIVLVKKKKTTTNFAFINIDILCLMKLVPYKL